MGIEASCRPRIVGALGLCACGAALSLGGVLSFGPRELVSPRGIAALALFWAHTAFIYLLAIFPLGPRSGVQRARFIVSPVLSGWLVALAVIAGLVGAYRVLLVLVLMAVATVPVGLTLGLTSAVRRVRR